MYNIDKIIFVYYINILFHIKKEADQAPYFDHSCTRGLGAAYDYVLEQTRTKKSDKEAYPNALLKMSQGDTKSYYDYMLKSMKTSQDKIIKQLKSSKIR